MTINYKDVSNKSIKIFLNGKIQITGLTSMIESNKIGENICEWIERMSGEKVEVKEMKVGMINSNFKLNWGVNLPKLLIMDVCWSRLRSNRS